MNAKELGEIILGLQNNSERKSTLQLALKGARGHLSVNGEKPTPGLFREHQLEKYMSVADPGSNAPEEADMFCALLLYLICLEQLSTIFYNGKIEDIIRRYNHYALNEFQIGAISGLRHALAHSFGLINAKNGKSPIQKFTIVFYGKNTNIIELPSDNFSYEGYHDKKEESSIHVYAFSLIDLIEYIVQMVTDDFKRGLVSVQDTEKVQARYTILNNVWSPEQKE